MYIFKIYHDHYLFSHFTNYSYSSSFVNVYNSFGNSDDVYILNKDVIKDDTLDKKLDYYILFNDDSIPDELIDEMIDNYEEVKEKADRLIEAKAHVLSADAYYKLLRRYPNLECLNNLADYHTEMYLYEIKYFIKHKVKVDALTDEISSIEKYLEDVLSGNEVGLKDYYIGNTKSDIKTVLERVVTLLDILAIKFEDKYFEEIFNIALTIDKYDIVKDSNFNPVQLLKYIYPRPSRDMIRSATEWYINNNIMDDELSDILINACIMSKYYIERESLEQLTLYYIDKDPIDLYNYLKELNTKINIRNFENLFLKSKNVHVGIIAIYIYVTSNWKLINSYFKDYESYKEMLKNVLCPLEVHFTALDNYIAGMPDKFKVRNLRNEELNILDVVLKEKPEFERTGNGKIRIVNAQYKDADDLKTKAKEYIKKER